MTRWLLNSKIPKFVVAPTCQEIGIESREVSVTGIGTVKKCPNCGRKGPIDALTLGDGSVWPNLVIVCGKIGSNGCGLFWSLSPEIPDNIHTLQ